MSNVMASHFFFVAEALIFHRSKTVLPSGSGTHAALPPERFAPLVRPGSENAGADGGIDDDLELKMRNKRTFSSFGGFLKAQNPWFQY